MASASKEPQAFTAIDSDGVSVITLSYPPLNALHPKLLQSFFEALRRSQADPKVKAIVVTGANNTFCPGFDIAQFQNSSGGGVDNTINDSICELLENGAKPTVAAVEGVALGGGLEVAMGCNARICKPGTRFGLPELTLGIIPGFGGTQRLPRLVGLKKGVEMILTSTMIADAAALKAGLVDAVVPKDQLMKTAKAYALEMAAGRKPRQLSLFRTDKLEAYAEAMQIIDFARDETIKKAKGMQHPLHCLDAIRFGVEHGGLMGIKREVEMFALCASLDSHKALVHIFFAQRATKKIKGVTDAGLKPRQMKVVAVIGGGLMGSGIATSLVQANYDVLLKEINQQFLDGGMARIRSNLESGVKKGKITKAAMEAMLAKVKGVLTYDEFKTADYVIEAAIESIPLKQAIFLDLEKACKPDCILSSNTSTIDINLCGAKTSAQSRIVGAHFFSPAHIMPLLEIVRTEHTSKQVILDTLELTSRIKKTPVVVGNCTGFAVNRVFFPYTMSACLLLDMGLNPYLVDQAIFNFGMPMGPFRLSDLVGADIGLHVGKNFIDSFPERVYLTRVIPAMNEAKRLGEKTGKGFYKYDAKRRTLPDAEITPLVMESVKAAGLVKANGGKPFKLSDQEIVEFIFFPVINEACRVLAEGIVEKPADLDVATVMSMGFPAHKGGLVFWADLVGAKHICARLDAFAAMLGPNLAGYFKPCEYLRAAATSGRKLSAGSSAPAKL